MLLCAVTQLIQVAIVRLHSDLDTHFWSKILETITILTGSLAVISLLSINKPYIALIWFLVWFLFAAHRIHTLILDLNRPLLPITSNMGSNSNYVTTIIGKMKFWATNLLQWCAAVLISVVHRRSMLDRRIGNMVQQVDV
ncbi:hypothetical protein SLA2020_215560 [Shorea laevis]